MRARAEIEFTVQMTEEDRKTLRQALGLAIDAKRLMAQRQKKSEHQVGREAGEAHEKDAARYQAMLEEIVGWLPR